MKDILNMICSGMVLCREKFTIGGGKVKTKILNPSDWENGGIIICMLTECEHLVSSSYTSGKYNSCYQKGGMHFYCDSEDTMAAGCLCPNKINLSHFKFLEDLIKNRLKLIRDNSPK